MQCAAENRICWRYHRPSIHYYQTINYTESNLINLIGSSWIIFCKQKVPDAIEYNILMINIFFSILQVTQPYDKWNIHKQHILKIYLWIKIDFSWHSFFDGNINNIITTCKKKSYLDTFLTRIFDQHEKWTISYFCSNYIFYRIT